MTGCHWCGEGHYILNEETGVERCGNCGCPTLLQGGQGHTSSDVRTSSTILSILLLVGAVTGLFVIVWLCGRM